MRAIQSVFGTISFNLDMHYDTVIMTLVEHNYIAYLGGDDYVYYFAHKGKRRTVEKSEYSKAWREYWSDKESGMDYYTAIYTMIVHYGGVARKQAVPTVNAIYGKKIDEMLFYIEQSIENEIVHELYAEEPELGEEILKQMLPDDADWDEDVEKRWRDVKTPLHLFIDVRR